MQGYPSLAELDARRAHERREIAWHAAHQVLAMLAERGIKAEVVGSLARTDFGRQSDVDFLIYELADPKDRYTIEGPMEDLMEGLPFDVIYLDEVRSSRKREQLLREASDGSDLAGYRR